MLIVTHEINERDFIKRIDECYRIESKALIKFFYLFELIYELNKLDKYSIVIRPHPGMETEKVKNFFESYKKFNNVKVIADGDLIDQISTSDFIIHTGCTSGVEGTLNKKNVITYLPNDNLINDSQEVRFLTEIGKVFYKKDAIIKYIKRNTKRKLIQKNTINKNLDKIKKRVLIDKQSFKRISKEIENLSFRKTNNSFSNVNNKRLNFFKKDIKLIVKKKIKKILNIPTHKTAFELKFPPFSKTNIIDRIELLNKGFNINTKYSLNFIDNRFLKISKFAD